jgi:DNA-binding response OmpR family regulator
MAALPSGVFSALVVDDDDVTKPFSPREVAIRVTNVLRLTPVAPRDVLRFDR